MPRCCATILDTNPVVANPAGAANPAVAGGKDQADPAVLVYCEAFHEDEQTAQDAAVEAAKAAFAKLAPGAPVPAPVIAVKPGRLKKSQLNNF